LLLHTRYGLQFFDESCHLAALKYTLSHWCFCISKYAVSMSALPDQIPPTIHGIPRFPYTFKFWTKCEGSHWL